MSNCAPVLVGYKKDFFVSRKRSSRVGFYNSEPGILGSVCRIRVSVHESIHTSVGIS